MAFVCLLDCAFCFFQNQPCRLVPTELNCGLPCDESVFSTEIPTQKVQFQRTRDITIYSAFRRLFDDQQPVPQTPYTAPRSHPKVASPEPFSQQSVTALDMFILGHRMSLDPCFSKVCLHLARSVLTFVSPLVLYAFVHSHVALVSPFIRNCSSQFSEDPTLTAIRTALSRWQTMWTTIDSNVSIQGRGILGFYKNGYNFWLASQFLIRKKESVDALTSIGVTREHKLHQLQIVLQNDN